MGSFSPHFQGYNSVRGEGVLKQNLLNCTTVCHVQKISVLWERTWCSLIPENVYDMPRRIRNVSLVVSKSLPGGMP